MSSSSPLLAPYLVPTPFLPLCMSLLSSPNPTFSYSPKSHLKGGEIGPEESVGEWRGKRFEVTLKRSEEE
jgi:hypothetical protein